MVKIFKTEKSKNKKHLRGSTQATIHPLAIILPLSSMGLGQYNSIGEYCDPQTASCVFLTFIFTSIDVGRVIHISIYVYLCKQEKTTYFFGTVIFRNKYKKVAVGQ